MTGLLKNKVGLITGAGSGIGRATATVFAREGCKVVVSDINEAGGKETVAQILAAGGEAVFFAADVGDEQAVQALTRFAVDHYGRLDVAVNNAGIEPEFVPMHELSLTSWNQNIRVNLTGVFLCMKHQISHMRDHGGGAIVNISSIGAAKAMPGIHVYAAAKRGVIALAGCAAVEYGAQNIRVNRILPGGIATRMLEDSVKGNPEVIEKTLKNTPLGKFGIPDDIAQAAAWLCSDAAGYVTGQHFAVDGGFTA